MRTVLADDNKEIRGALRLLLEELGERDIAEAADLGEALQVVRQGRVSTGPELTAALVVLLDWELPAGSYPNGGCPAFVADLKRSCPGCRVIAMSGRPEARAASLRARCDAFISRTDAPDRLVALLAEESPARDLHPEDSSPNDRLREC